ncbi:hypothetical protein BH09PAT4_BH09PAT4_08650 [soil metagenome]
MSTLLRFVIILVVLVLAGLGMLAVAGALSSSQLRDSALKVVELAGIVLVSSALILFISKK